MAREGRALGCKEALFTLGEKPELRYKAAREALETMGYATTTRIPARGRARPCSTRRACCLTRIPAR